MKYIRSQKNKPQLVYRGYTYNKKLIYPTNGNIVWRCVDMHKYKCLATCIVNKTKMIKGRLEHNHPPRKSTKQIWLTDLNIEQVYANYTNKKDEINKV